MAKYKPKKYEWDVLKTTYGDEIKLKKELQKVFKQAIDDLSKNIQWLYDGGTPSKIRQAKYQEQILNEVENSLNLLSSSEIKSVKDYIKKSYTTGYASSLFCLNKQGVPYIRGVRTSRVIKAITETALSESVEKTLYKDILALKKPIQREITRGVTSGLTFNETAKNIVIRTNIAKNRAMTIARTEGHRVANSASMDALRDAGEIADVKKQWCATLDDRTRFSHRMLDGEIRDIDEEFSNGLMYPGDPSGDAEEVINCRCTLLQRASPRINAKDLKSWEIRSEELGVSKLKDFSSYRDVLENLPEGD